MVNNSNITGTIPYYLEHLFQLDIMVLWDMGVTGTIDQDIFEIDGLISVVFDNNRSTGIMRSTIL